MSDLKDFIFTHKEMAKLLGISSNALRMRLRNGNQDNLEMRMINGKKMYKRPRDDKAIRPPGRWNNQTPAAGHAALSTGQKIPGPKSNKPVTRGGHFNGKYPNYAFEKHNEIKMFAKLTNKSLTPETISLIPDAMKIAAERRAQDLARKSQLTFRKDYGGIYNPNTRSRYRSLRYYPDPDGTRIFDKPKDEYDLAMEELERDGAFNKKGPYEI